MIMKKTLLSVISVFTLSAYSQASDIDSYYKGIESYRDLQLSAEQIAKIKKLKRKVGSKFVARRIICSMFSN